MRPKPAVNSDVIKEVFAAHIKAKFGGKPVGDRNTLRNLRLKHIEIAINWAEGEGLKIKLNNRKNLCIAEEHVIELLVALFDYPDPYNPRSTT
jgi:hypothetical protein